MNACKGSFTLLLLLMFSAAAVQAECVREDRNKEVVGTLVGAALGGLVGSQIGGGTGNKIAIAGGVLAGGYIGNSIGKKLDCQDLAYHQQTYQDSLENTRTGTATTWRNPDTGHSGTVIPTKTYMAQGDTPCREFTQIIRTGDEVEEVKGTACRQEDGSWRIVEG